MRLQFTIAHWFLFTFLFGLCLGWRHDHELADDKLADEAVKFHGAQLKIQSLDNQVLWYSYANDLKCKEVTVLTQQLAGCRRDLKWAEERYSKLRGPLPPEHRVGDDYGDCAPAPGGPELMWPDKER